MKTYVNKMINFINKPLLTLINETRINQILELILIIIRVNLLKINFSVKFI